MEEIFGTKTTKQGNKAKSETDSNLLCDSKHEVWVYTTDFSDNGTITPGEDNIIVSFVGTDSAGTGCVGDILEGGLKLFTDPVDWYTTVVTGFGGALADEDSWIGRDSVIGDAAVDSGAAAGYVAVVDAVLDIPTNIGTIWNHYTDDDDDDDDECFSSESVKNAQGHNNSPELTSMRKLRDRYGNWFAADEVREYYQISPRIVANINRSPNRSEIYTHLHSEYIVPVHQQVTQGNYGTAHKIYKNMMNYTRRFAADSGESCFDDFGGTVLHNANGRGHKVSIKITCNGEIMYDTEMAGSDKRETSGDNLLFLGTNKSFKITKPGTWKVTVESLSSHAECATPTLDETWTINVPKPAGWDDSAPVIQTQTEEVKAITNEINTQLKELGLKEDTDPLTIFAGIVLGGGILIYGLLSYLGSGSDEEEDSE